MMSRIVEIYAEELDADANEKYVIVSYGLTDPNRDAFSIIKIDSITNNGSVWLAVEGNRTYDWIDADDAERIGIALILAAEDARKRKK